MTNGPVDHDIWLTNWLEERTIQVQVARNVRIERFLQGSEQLSFELKLDDPKLAYIHEDQTIEAYGDKWVVDHFEDKHVTAGYRKVVCNGYWIRLSWRTRVGTFSVLGQTPADGLEDIITGTTWTVVDPPANADLYTMEEIDGTILGLIRRWAKITGYEVEFDNVNETIRFTDEVGQNRQIGFRWGYNLTEITRTYYPPQATRLTPIGANDLTIEAANPSGLLYIEDYTFYTDKGLTITQARDRYRKDLTWVDQRYLLSVNLYDAAVRRLSKLSQPRIFYAAKVIDLSRVMGDADPLEFGYAPGDYCYVDDEELGLLEEVRVTRTVSFPAEPKRDEVELGFLTNGLLDVSDGGNRDVGYDSAQVIIDENIDLMTIGISEVAYGSIALTSAGIATILSGSTFAGVSDGNGTVTFKFTVDGEVIGEEYVFDLIEDEQIEFSWPSFATGISEGAHEVQWRASTDGPNITLETGAGRSWLLTKGAVGVGQTSTPNQFVSEYIENLPELPVGDSETVITFFDPTEIDELQIEVSEGESVSFEDFVMTDRFVLPFTLEHPVFGELDGPGVLSDPSDPVYDYHPPDGGAEGGSFNFGPGPISEIPYQPWDYIDWMNVYWANGPQFESVNSSPGSITAWPDELDNTDMSLTGSILDDEDAALNNRASVHINGNGDQYAAMPSTAHTVVVVAWHPSAAGNNRWHDSHSSGRWVMGVYSGDWQIYFGSSAADTEGADTDPHLFLYHEDGSNDRMDLDNTTIYGPSNYGSGAIDQLNIVDDGDGVHIAFLATHAADPADDPGWEDFLEWVAEFYGITLA